MSSFNSFNGSAPDVDLINMQRQQMLENTRLLMLQQEEEKRQRELRRQQLQQQQGQQGQQPQFNPNLLRSFTNQGANPSQPSGGPLQGFNQSLIPDGGATGSQGGLGAALPFALIGAAIAGRGEHLRKTQDLSFEDQIKNPSRANHAFLDEMDFRRRAKQTVGGEIGGSVDSGLKSFSDLFSLDISNSRRNFNDAAPIFNLLKSIF